MIDGVRAMGEYNIVELRIMRVCVVQQSIVG